MPLAGCFRLNGWPWLLPALLLLLAHRRPRAMDAGANFARAVGGCRYRAVAAERRSAGAMGFSLQHLARGLLLGAIAGTLLGALFGLVPAAAQRVEPLFYALAQIPTLGWIPLFMVLFGIDNGLKLAVIVKTTRVPMTIHTQQR
jgi:sulfonate transport system permease protein